MNMNNESMISKLESDGWLKLEGVYDQELMERVKHEIEEVKPVFARIQREAGVAEDSRNATHHTVLLCPSMLELIDPNPIHDFLEQYFEGRYILNTMGASVVNSNNDYVYTQKIHRDIRSNSGQCRLLLNTLVMLDDSTEHNGATWMLSGSQSQIEKPSEDYFYKNAVRATGKQGDLLVFNGNIWHAAGVNSTDKPRNIITPIYTKPYIKQALDYPRAFGMNYRERISTQLQQILGYNAMVPQTLEEFYQPLEKRFYKSDQG